MGEAPRYAGFWIRLLACLLDGAMVFIPGIVLMWLFHVGPFNPSFHFHYIKGQSHPAPMVLPHARMIGAIGYLVGMVYQTLMMSSSWQGTVGMRCCGIKITDYQGQRLTWPHAFGRWFADEVWFIPKSLTVLLPGLILLAKGLKWIGLLGWLAMVFTPRKQMLQDYLARTLVICNRSSVS